MLQGNHQCPTYHLLKLPGAAYRLPQNSHLLSSLHLHSFLVCHRSTAPSLPYISYYPQRIPPTDAISTPREYFVFSFCTASNLFDRNLSQQRPSRGSPIHTTDASRFHAAVPSLSPPFRLSGATPVLVGFDREAPIFHRLRPSPHDPSSCPLCLISACFLSLHECLALWRCQVELRSLFNRSSSCGIMTWILHHIIPWMCISE